MTVQSVSYGTAYGSITIELTLFFKTNSPVCCPEPGCYISFVGWCRTKVPVVLAAVLELPEQPQVTIHATLNYQDGYRHSQVNFGRNMTRVAIYLPSEFQSGQPDR